MGVLERGGNAFDAAFAGGMVLQVAEPHMNGPGGDLTGLLYLAGAEQPLALCGQGPAPKAATIAHYRDLGFDVVPGTGLLAAVVPGAFGAWCAMLRDHGTLSLSEALAPALGYAANGCPMVARVTATIAAVEPLFRDHWTTSAAVYLPNGAAPEPDALLANPGLAETWHRLIREAESASGDRAEQIEAARRAWYQGFVAEAMAAFCRDNEVLDVSGRAHRGLLTADDMAAWSPPIEPPESVDYHGFTVFKCGAWSQGPAFLQSLAILRDMDVGGMDPLGDEFVHTVVEAQKLGFADREVFYGDPDFVAVPLETLLSDAYAAERRAQIDAQASMEFRPGRIDGYGAPFDYDRVAARPAPSGMLADVGGGEPTTARLDYAGRPAPQTGDTCHIDVIDKDGNMVAIMPSGGWLQSSPVVPELGFCLGTRAQMFWLDEKSPSALAPGRRPRTTLTPGMAFRNGDPYLAFGTPGGDQQDQWQLIMLLRHIHHGMTLQQAIDAPSFHGDHHPSSFYPRMARRGSLTVEDRFPESTIRGLERRGHVLEVGDGWSEGRLCACARDGNLLRAAANARGMQGYAVGR